jgi:hypothetical protein
LCAWFGALTHRVWDTFTHGSIDTAGQPIAALNDVAFAGLPWWHVLQYTSTLLGALAVVAMAAHIGRRRLLIEWHGESDPIAVSRSRFWIMAAIVWAGGLAITAAFDGGGVALVVRALIVAAIGLLVGACVASTNVEMAGADTLVP